MLVTRGQYQGLKGTSRYVSGGSAIVMAGFLVGQDLDGCFCGSGGFGSAVGTEGAHFAAWAS